ncbi:MAG: hypothetical protein RIM23_29725 [Coleofasciculus sp. G3-WIS-01]|uniref:hypothetical protein n=1 Tax=Coleofasciculus sp. G3-WIS-01 TaxID=3069528 RepID=UPI0032FC1E42
MSSHSTTPNIDEFLQRLETILLQAWSETGFGRIEVSSERFKEDKIRVIIQGSTSYRYVITNQEVEQKVNGTFSAFSSTTVGNGMSCSSQPGSRPSLRHSA